MTLFETIAIFAAAAALAALVAAGWPKVLAELSSLKFWSALMVLAALLSAASCRAEATRHAGTGFTTSYGWPKPFYFRFLAEDGVRTADFQLLYFLANSLVYAALLLAVRCAWRILR